MITITIDHDAIATALAALRGLSAPFAERREVTCTTCGEPCLDYRRAGDRYTCLCCSIDAAKTEALRDRDILLREVREADARERMARQEVDEAAEALGHRARNGIVAGVRELIEDLGAVSAQILALTADRDALTADRDSARIVARLSDALRAEIDIARAELGDWDDPEKSLVDCIRAMNEGRAREMASLRGDIATLTAERDAAVAKSGTSNSVWGTIDDVRRATDAAEARTEPTHAGLSRRALMRDLAARQWTGTRDYLAELAERDLDWASIALSPSHLRSCGVGRADLGDGIYRLSLVGVAPPARAPKRERPTPGRKPSPMKDAIRALAAGGWTGTRDEYAAALGVPRNTAQEWITPGRLRELGVVRHDVGVGRFSLRPSVVPKTSTPTAEPAPQADPPDTPAKDSTPPPQASARATITARQRTILGQLVGEGEPVSVERLHTLLGVPRPTHGRPTRLLGVLSAAVSEGVCGVDPAERRGDGTPTSYRIRPLRGAAAA